MEELYITMQKGMRNRKFSLISGTAQILLAVVLLYLNNEEPIISNYIFAPMMFSLGVLNIMDGLGKPFLFANNILINAEKILLNKGALKKQQYVEWKDVKSITEKPTEIKLITHNNNVYTFNFSEFPYRDVRKAKEFIRQITSEKGITWG